MLEELAEPRVDERLRSERIIWLTTVRSDGQPQTSPVWFLWDGETFLLYSMPGSQKVPNVRDNRHVSLNLDGDGDGGGIVTIEGHASLAEDAPTVDQATGYLSKYQRMIEDMGADAARFAVMYSTAIRVTPVRARIYQ